ncbi:electron transport complex protein RnfG [Klebsiella michiganensis]|nr:electron transport complex protein RnfG [Klebsiella michiganensis]
MLQSMRKHGITLALFAAGSTGLTAAINELTKSTIEDQAAQQQKALFDQVMPANLYNNDLLKAVIKLPPRRWEKASTRFGSLRMAKNRWLR